MSSKYDIESFLNDLVSVVQLNLETKIAAINAEKADSYCLSSIPNEHFFNDAAKQMFNVDPFIYYAIVDIKTDSNGHNTALTVKVNFEVVFNNKNKDGTLEKALRYSRALREIIQENFKGGRHSGLKISELLPGNAQLNNGADFKVGGISVTSTIVG